MDTSTMKPGKLQGGMSNEEDMSELLTDQSFFFTSKSGPEVKNLLASMQN
ncbi:unnamed protein product [Rhodiola kirilowii]